MDHVLKLRGALFLGGATSEFPESLFRLFRPALRQQPHWRIGSLKSNIFGRLVSYDLSAIYFRHDEDFTYFVELLYIRRVGAING